MTIQNALIKKLQIKLLNSYKINLIRTKLNQILHPGKSTEFIFIFGCQRSGTTVLSTLIGMSPAIQKYGEGDPPYFIKSESYLPRLRANPELLELRNCEKSKFILLKPLCESQNIHNLLQVFPLSKPIWIYRNFYDVVDSHIKYYGSELCYQYCEDIFEKKKTWLNTNISDKILEKVSKFDIKRLNPESCYAIFWFIRNSLFFDYDSNKLLLVRYENLVQNKYHELKRISEFLELPLNKLCAKIIYKKAVNKKHNLHIDPEIVNICKKLLIKFEHFEN